jgi:hypothetical protein
MRSGFMNRSLQKRLIQSVRKPDHWFGQIQLAEFGDLLVLLGLDDTGIQPL